MLHVLADFAVPETTIFIFFPFQPVNAKRSRQRRGLAAVPEIRIFTLKKDQARSGTPYFHARPGARSGALPHVSLCRGTYLPKFGVSTPPPPPPGTSGFALVIHVRAHLFAPPPPPK